MTNPTDPRIEAAARALRIEQCLSVQMSHTYARIAIKAADEAAWLPIESAPKDGTKIILFCPRGDGNPGSTFRVTEGEWYEPDETDSLLMEDGEMNFCGPTWMSWDGGFSEDTMMPTHWQPLPNPPPGK